MGNRPSAPSEEEEEKKPTRSISGDVTLPDHNGDDPDEFMPPPMEPISVQSTNHIYFHVCFSFSGQVNFVLVTNN